jgi:short subunit dehydrogenase-like uncharacterized protein
VIEEVPIAHSRRPIDFAGGSAMTVAIAWGDLATAYVSTGIPNIETYASMPLAAAIASRALNWARPLLACVPVQELVRRLADRSTGPSEEGAAHGEIPFLGRGAQCGGTARARRPENLRGNSQEVRAGAVVRSRWWRPSAGGPRKGPV